MVKMPSPPQLDPAKWWDHHAFRETFLADVHSDEEDVAAIREFGKVFNMMANEMSGGSWGGTYADFTGRCLRAALADLRYLQGYFSQFTIEKEQSLTPRDRRWHQFGLRMSERVAGLADAIEKELSEGLETPDE